MSQFLDESLGMPNFLRNISHSVSNIQMATSEQLLDLAVCIVINQGHLRMSFKSPLDNLLQWLADPENLNVLKALVSSQTTNLRFFARNWRWCTFWASRRSQKLLTAIKQTGGVFGASSNNRHYFGDWRTPFFTQGVVSTGDVDLCHQLVEYTKGTRYSNEVLNSGLLAATKLGHPRIVGLFLSSGASPSNAFDAKNPFGTGLCSSSCTKSLLGEVVSEALQWPTAVGSSIQLTETIEEFIKHDVASATLPCIGIFSAVDIVAFLCPPTLRTVNSMSDKLYGSLGFIARLAARTPNILCQLTSRSFFSQRDLELALFLAARSGRLDIASALLHSGVDPDCSSLLVTRDSGADVPSKSKNCRCGQICHFEGTLSQPLLEAVVRDHHISWDVINGVLPLLLEAGASITPMTVHYLGARCPSYRTWREFRRFCIPRLENMEFINTIGPSLLCTAAKWEDTDMVQSLLDSGVDIHLSLRYPMRVYNPRIRNFEYIDDFELSAMQFSILSCDYDIFNNFKRCTEVLWPYGAQGSFELLLACLSPRHTAAKVATLLECGAVPHPVAFGSTITCPLRVLIDSWHTSEGPGEAMSALLAAGANPNLLLPYDGGTPLELACRKGLIVAAATLLDHGSQIRSADIIRDAAQGSDFESKILPFIIRKCRKAGLDVTDGATNALPSVASLGRIDTAIQLLRVGANVNGPNVVHSLENAESNLPTPIETAAKFGCIDMVQLLINAGAEGSDETGLEDVHNAASDWTTTGVDDEWALVSIKNPFDMPLATTISHSSQEGSRTRYKRALQYAEEMGHFHVVELLKRYQ
jgi:ankyrin repeat protein